MVVYITLLNNLKKILDVYRMIVPIIGDWNEVILYFDDIVILKDHYYVVMIPTNKSVTLPFLVVRARDETTILLSRAKCTLVLNFCM